MNLLYVCTYWGVRSQIAEVLTNSLAIPGVTAISAGFETGSIGNLPIEAMAARGLILNKLSPPTLFQISRLGQPLDQVITLCNETSQENFDILYNVVDSLFANQADVIHWNVPDFMSITQTDSETRIEAAQEIISEIELKIRQHFSLFTESQARS